MAKPYAMDLRERAMRTAFVRRSVSRFMPGERLEDALKSVRAEMGGVSTASGAH